MARVVVNIPDSVDLSKVNDIKLCIRYCKDNDEYSYVTDGFSIQEERPQVELANEIWELYEKYHSHLATHVIEFGDELKDLLSKYQEGGKEE